MTDRVRNPVFARAFAALVASPLGKGMERDRRRLLDGLSGRVVEVGAGSGANFAFYPDGVTEVVAYEPEPYLRGKAESAGRRAAIAVRVADAAAEHLPDDDESFDACVVSLVLCSVGSPAAALAEIRRVLRPGGKLHFYEHVRAEHGFAVPRMQRLADATIWPAMSGGCHTSRDTVGAIEEAGFVIERLKRLEFKPLGIPTPITPHALGVARKP